MSNPKSPRSAGTRKGGPVSPKRRPKQNQQQFHVGFLFRKVARDLVAIEVNGTRTMISYWEAYLRQIYSMSLNKNNSAARLLEQIRRQFPGGLLPGDPIYFRISENDAKC